MNSRVTPRVLTAQQAFHALLGRIGTRARTSFPIHLHFTCCDRVAVANAGHDARALQAYLGHKNIQHMVRHGGRAG